MRICNACRRREEWGVGELLRVYTVRVQGPLESDQHGELGTYELCEGCHERLIAAVRDAVDGVVNPTRAEGDTKGAGHDD
jgi:hypothetical protein